MSAAGGPSASREDVLAVLARIAEAELELAGPLDPAARLARDLELDSMGLTIMAVGLENHFRIKLDEAEGPALDTVEDVIALVQRRVRERDEAR